MKKLKCKICDKIISTGSKSGLCRSCANRISSTGRKHTQETKDKMSNSCKGEKHHMWGKHHKKESIKKISQNVSKALTGKKRKSFSKKWCENISKATSGENNPMFGKFHSKQTRDKMSKAKIGKKASESTRKKLSESRKGKKNSMFGKVTHGKWGKYKGINMRSSWEILYAKYLDKNKIKWIYEPKAFDLGDATYTPDFYLPKENLYIEIKGFWRDNSKKKFNSFKKTYKEVKIKVLTKPDLEKLKIKL
jgi:hypothetical protein